MLIIDFLKNPVQYRDNPLSLTPSQTGEAIIKWYVYMLVGMCLAIIFIIAPLKLGGLLPERWMNPAERNFFLLVFAGPIIEEVICRLPIRYSRINLTLSLLFVIVFVGRLYIGWIGAAIVSICFLFIAYLLLFRKENNRIDQLLEQFWSVHFNLIFYFYTLLFGLMHITNFHHLGLRDYLLSPLITSPQIVLGFILGLVRIRYQKGIWIAILLHILLNAGSGIISLLK